MKAAWSRSVHRRRRAITLFEVIVAIALIALLLSSLLTFFWQIAETRDSVNFRSERTLLARSILDKIATELRGCIGVEQLGFPVAQRLRGDRFSITFLTAAVPEREQFRFYSEADVLPPAKHDLQEVSYRLWVDEQETDEFGEPLVGGILRTVRTTLNQLVVEEDDTQVVRTDLWSHELGFLEFRYFDGVDWDVEWDVTEGNSLPQAVQITIGYRPVTMQEWEWADLEEYRLEEYPLGDDREHPDRYSIVVRLGTADKFFGSRLQRVGERLANDFGIGGLP